MMPLLMICRIEFENRVKNMSNNRYMPLMKAIIKHAIIVSGGLNEKVSLSEGIQVTVLEWLVVELVVEQRSEYYSMIELSRKIGIPPSSLSRIVSRLQKIGLIEKYHIQDNNKTIVLRPSKLALGLYEERTPRVGGEIWNEFFDALESFSDSEIGTLTSAFQELNERLPSARFSQEPKLVEAH